jgi:hypothetical protein
MKKTLSRKLLALSMSMIAVMATAGCAGSSDGTKSGAIDDPAASLAMTTAMEAWLSGNIDLVAEQLGFDMTGPPIDSFTATTAMKEGLHDGFDVEVVEITSAQASGYDGTVRVGFPMVVKLSIGKLTEGSTDDPGVQKEYRVTALFDIATAGGEVTEASRGYQVKAASVPD